MAYNQYTQRSQAQPSRGQYQEQPHQNGWSNGGGHHYENEYQQQGSQSSRDYAQQEGGQYGYNAANGHYYGKDPYDQPTQSHNPPEGQYYDQQQHTQHYQYDPRYKNQNQAPNGQVDPRQDRRQHQEKDKHRPPQMDLKAKPKCKWFTAGSYVANSLCNSSRTNSASSGITNRRCLGQSVPSVQSKKERC
jgi:hypothetical protein